MSVYGSGKRVTWWRNLWYGVLRIFQPVARTTTTYSRPMTQAEKEALDAAFAQIDVAFAELDKAFKMMRTRP